MRFLSSCAFRGKGAAPQRSRVDPIGIEGEHPVVEVACRCGLAVHPIEIADISTRRVDVAGAAIRVEGAMAYDDCLRIYRGERSEEHTSELQSRRDLVCRLLLE